MNSLGINKLVEKTRVIVAMSGGVDSSVTAALLKEQGYDVAGITLQLYDHGEASAQSRGACEAGVPQGSRAKTKSCCAGQDIYDARNVSAALNIPHYVLDYENRFKESVMDDFADTYLRGETPIPCVRCNQRVKFRDLLEAARDLGADALATGHYARRVMGRHGAELHAGRDPARDQSYFLFATTRAQMDFLRFPLGDMEKTEVRKAATRFGLPVAEKPDSQDICFVPNGNYAEVVKKLRPGAIDPGEIVDEEGRALGRHEGVIHFTVGQRKGLQLSSLGGMERAPLYVTGIDAASRRVTVGPREALAVARVKLKETNWPTDTGASVAVNVKFRSAMDAVPARLEGDVIAFTEPQYGVSPGQACVAYDGARVLGGGWIEKAEKAALKPGGDTTERRVAVAEEPVFLTVPAFPA